MIETVIFNGVVRGLAIWLVNLKLPAKHGSSKIDKLKLELQLLKALAVERLFQSHLPLAACLRRLER